jgi:fructose-bisphosphate aldolase class I
MDIATLSATAKALVAPGKGILAADESGGTIKKRFDSISVDSTETNRRDYREMLFTAKDIGNYISGVILFDETIRQDAADGTPSTTRSARASPSGARRTRSLTPCRARTAST